MDAIVRFRPLDAGVLTRIAAKQLRQVLLRAESEGLRVSVRGEPAARLGAACAGDPAGARALRHRIQDSVETPLAELLLRGVKRCELDGTGAELAVRRSPAHGLLNAGC